MQPCFLVSLVHGYDVGGIRGQTIEGKNTEHKHEESMFNSKMFMKNNNKKNTTNSTTRMKEDTPKFYMQME